MMDDNKTLGYGLVAAGGFFLLTQLLNISLFGILWPLIIIAPGAVFLNLAMSGGKAQTGFIFPGSIITGTGLILLYQAITGHWESWAYIWTLYPVMVGLALEWQGKRLGSKGEAETGKMMTKIGLMSFAGFAFFFEVLIFGSVFGGLTGLLWPLALIGLGAYLASNRKRSRDENTSYNYNGVPKRKYADPSADINPDLKRKIEDALREDAYDDNASTSNYR